ncbi:right-handed parallel beta-helix repeat-containing protein [Streptomyces sp. NPDC096152]|uniref:right-handed parallel beta-helix repeat-containing protein n=1 Tax=Streptomyces sp. NPDC096152 TaxID=3366078 RepID=UPI0037FF6DF3
MKRRALLSAFVVAVATVFPAFPAVAAAPGRAAASTLIVDDDLACPGATYSTIQSAVDAAAAGDTIQVCAGTYNEIVDVNKPNLTLVGQTKLPADCDVFAEPKPAVDSIIEATNLAGEGIVNLREDNIRFQGFTVQNNQGSALGGYGVNTSVNHSGYLVTNNVIQGNPAGMYFNASGTTPSQVTQNCIRLNNTGFGVQAPAGNGIYSDQGLDNARIDHNAFFQNKNGAITLDKYQNTLRATVDHNVSHQDNGLLNIFHSTGSVVTDNQAVDNTGSAIYLGGADSRLQVLRNDIQGSYHGVRAENVVGGPSEANDQIQISNNNIRNTTLGDGISAGPSSLTRSTISDNSVNNSGHDGVLIEDTGSNADNVVTRNVLLNSKVFDCEDLTKGDGTAGTADTWTDNRANTSNPTGLCPKPVLTIKKTHAGNFTQGRQGTYTITVGNDASGGPTNGSTVTLHDTLPAGLTATGISGTGWDCTLSTLTCTRSGSLAPGASYPPITLTVDVSCNAPAQGTDTATVTGGGDTGTHTAVDPTTIDPNPECRPSLTIEKTHKKDFKEGQRGTYTITVGNAGPGPTDGSTVTVHDVLPRGLTAASISGAGWTCDLATLTCTRSDVLAAGASYPPITLTADVPCECKIKKGIDTVTVTGGGDSATHTATDPTVIKRDKHCKSHKPHKPHKPGHH